MLMASDRLTLKKAIQLNRLGDFISQAEADGIGPGSEPDTYALLREASKPLQSEDQTSRSPSRDGSSGT